MRRFFINNQIISDNKAVITGSDVHHIRDVLRLSSVDRIVLIDDKGTEYQVEIIDIQRHQISARIISTQHPDISNISIELFQGLPKGSKFDEVVEKATELGADSISPVLMERTIAKIEAASLGKRVLRWQRISESAAKQCKRLTMPKINPVIYWADLIVKLNSFDNILAFWEGATEFPDKFLCEFKGNNIAVCIGPEGGFAAGEITALLKLNANLVSLGPRILRTETAPVVALSIVNHLLKR